MKAVLNTLGVLGILMMPALSGAAIPCKSEATKKNADQSTTITNPTILRGDQEFHVVDGVEGLCKTFGFNTFMSNSVEWATQSERGASLDDDGTFAGVINDVAITKLTCYNQGELQPKILTEAVKKNPDGSTTFEKPLLSRGDQTFQIRMGIYGVCKLLGFDSVLTDTLKWSEIESEAAANLNDDGTFAQFSNGKLLQSITCYNDSELHSAKSADSIKKNPDGSVTLIRPVMLVGSDRLPIADGPVGLCKVFGFDSYMPESIQWTDDSQNGAILNNDGSIKDTDNNISISKITCYN